MLCIRKTKQFQIYAVNNFKRKNIKEKRSEIFVICFPVFCEGYLWSFGRVYIWVMAAGEADKAASYSLPGGGGSAVNILGNEYKIHVNTHYLL